MTGGMGEEKGGRWGQRENDMNKFFFGHVITYLNMWTICPLAREIGLCSYVCCCLCVLGKYRGFDRCVFI